MIKHIVMWKFKENTEKENVGIINAEKDKLVQEKEIKVFKEEIQEAESLISSCSK